MQLIVKLTSILLAATASALSVQSAVIARHNLAEVSVVLYEDVSEVGASYSPDGLVQGVCYTLPGDWLDRAESFHIGAGYSCSFYELQGCEGLAIALSGAGDLPSTLYDNTESFFCTKAII